MALVELTEESGRHVAGGKKVYLNIDHIAQVDPESGRPNTVIVTLVTGEKLNIMTDYDAQSPRGLFPLLPEHPFDLRRNHFVPVVA
jgi:hypothetical protein